MKKALCSFILSLALTMTCCINVFATGGTLSFVVRNSSGQPIPNAKVYCYPDVTSTNDLCPIILTTTSAGLISGNDFDENVQYGINVFAGSNYVQYVSPTKVSTNQLLSITLQTETATAFSSPLALPFFPPSISANQNYGWRYSNNNGINFLENHYGEDISRKMDGSSLAGTDVKSIFPSMVQYSAFNPYRGYYVEAKHITENLYSISQHLQSAIFANHTLPFYWPQNGTIGQVGNSGLGSGAHLHIEMYEMQSNAKTYVEPFAYVCQTTVCTY